MCFNQAYGSVIKPVGEEIGGDVRKVDKSIFDIGSMIGSNLSKDATRAGSSIHDFFNPPQITPGAPADPAQTPGYFAMQGAPRISTRNKPTIGLPPWMIGS